MLYKLFLPNFANKAQMGWSIQPRPQLEVLSHTRHTCSGEQSLPLTDLKRATQQKVCGCLLQVKSHSSLSLTSP